MKTLTRLLIALFLGMALMFLSKGSLVVSLAKDLVYDTAKFGPTLAHAGFLAGFCIFIAALINLIIYDILLEKYDLKIFR
ncbi:MAG: hypothetical protein E6L02_05245 [Thaumarchaeota archaeon]|nr:MAG: hypothetical protein E6L02_05245 [Nitrososphaerota archaeon]